MAETQAVSRFNLSQVPGLRQAVLLLGIAAAVAIGVAVVLWSRTPSYGLLFSHLSGKDTTATIQALQNADIAYHVDAQSGTIMVPTDKLNKARMKLAAQGLPETGNVGQDMLGGKSSSFGVSDFVQKARYQQMLEKDLAHTIASLRSVKSARVHLALPKQSVFVRNRRAARASVLVDLYRGRDLNASQVAAIMHLVASSVANLDSDNVTVVDQQGHLLTNDENGAMAASRGQYRLRRNIEHGYEKQINRILTPLVGAGNVHAQVVAALDFTHTERTSESYDPDKNAVRSEHTSRKEHSGASGPIGIPGALSNTPPAPPRAERAQSANGSDSSGAEGANPGDDSGATSSSKSKSDRPRSVSTSATRNYELNHTISHVEEPVGVLNRLSVAVVIDAPPPAGPSDQNSKPGLSQQQLARYTALVKEAVGFSAKRGDTVTVVGAPFKTAKAPAPLAAPSWWQRPSVRNIIKQVLGVVIALALILAVLRPLFKSLVRPSAGAPARLMPPPAGENENDELDADRVSLTGGATPAAPSAGALNYEQKMGMAKRVATEDPRRVAQVVKNWVGEDG
jgi:flagellar M-ring protein FliF